jgi:hypothetical protein
MKFHGFQAKWASYEYNHDIVCSNYPKLCICVPLGMANNVQFGCFPFLGIKSSFFIFLAPKMGSFLKHLPKICFKSVPPYFYKILYHILCTIHHLFAWKKFSSHHPRNRQISIDLVESGSNLNYRCFIVCSCFSMKIIFRYISSYFIIEGSCWPFWPHFNYTIMAF